MTRFGEPEARPRKRNYEETHRVLIEKAVELISKSGVEAASIAALARATKTNRSTVYYHFDSRESLIAAVCKWSSDQLANGVNPESGHRAAVDHISSFVLNNPEIIKLWIDDYIAEGDIHERYPQWDNLVAQINRAFADAAPNEPFDAEVYCALMLTSVFIAPRVFKNSVRPEQSLTQIAERFTREQQRILRREGVQATWLKSS